MEDRSRGSGSIEDVLMEARMQVLHAWLHPVLVNELVVFMRGDGDLEIERLQHCDSLLQPNALVPLGLVRVCVACECACAHERR